MVTSSIIECGGGNITLHHNTITNNTVDQGCVIEASYATVSLHHNVITGNTALCGVEGIFTTFTISSNVFTGSTGPGIGCGFAATATITNNTIVGNGQGIYDTGASGGITAVNNTIADNGIGVESHSSHRPIFRHNNVYGNGANYQNVDDPTGKNGNISQDPLFVDRSSGDYRLMPLSPSVDAGDDSVVGPDETDLDGTPRIQGKRVDMGAFENPNPAVLYRWYDAATALRAAAGLKALTAEEREWLDVEAGESSVGTVHLGDVMRLVRKIVGLDVVQNRILILNRRGSLTRRHTLESCVVGRVKLPRRYFLKTGQRYMLIHIQVAGREHEGHDVVHGRGRQHPGSQPGNCPYVRIQRGRAEENEHVRLAGSERRGKLNSTDRACQNRRWAV